MVMQKFETCGAIKSTGYQCSHCAIEECEVNNLFYTEEEWRRVHVRLRHPTAEQMYLRFPTICADASERKRIMRVLKFEIRSTKLM